MAIIVDRYTISAYEASELVEAYNGKQGALDGAIDLARERARLYFMPARWEATWLPDGSILVKRYRNKIEKSGGKDAVSENNSMG